MQFRLLGISGYVESVVSVRMSQGRQCSYEKACQKAQVSDDYDH